MADQQIELWCYVERRVFNVSTLYNGTVEDLQEQIYNDDKILPYFTRRRVGSAELTLTKVRYIMIPMRTLIY